VNSFRAALSIPGEVLLGDGLALSSELRPVGADFEAAGATVVTDRRSAVVDAGRLSVLAVRYRRPGDRFSPLGLGGRKKLQDYFVDRKVPRAERDRTPLVVDADDRIVWVAGHGIAEDFRVSDGTRAVVILKLRGERV
jgi:tRNA(Ile)-lysidine synthetase-like protein